MMGSPILPGTDCDLRNLKRALILLAFIILPNDIFYPKAKGQPDPGEMKVSYAGARSSAYGIKPFPSPEGWTGALKTMAGYFPGATPVGIWIVGRLNGRTTGMTLEFPKPINT